MKAKIVHISYAIEILRRKNREELYSKIKAVRNGIDSKRIMSGKK